MSIEEIKKEFLENSCVELPIKRWQKKNESGTMIAIFEGITNDEFKKELDPFFTSFNSYGYSCYTEYHKDTNSMGFYIRKCGEPFEKKPIKLKKITFYLDKVPLCVKDVVLNTFYETKAAIDRGEDVIYSTSLVNMTFDLIDEGYSIFAVKNKKTIHFYPGMDNLGNKGIRKGHNLQKLIIAGFFNDDFEYNEND